MPHRIRAFLVAAWTLATCVGGASSARGDDPAGAPATAAAKFHAEDMALSAESRLPPGWRLLAADAKAPDAEARIAALLDEVATTAGAGPADVVRVLRSAAGPGGKFATFALVEADGTKAPIAAALAEACRKKGLASRDMGAPSRWLVVDAPADARDALLGAQLAWAAKGLAARSRALFKARDPQGSIAVAAAALALDPKSADAHVAAHDPSFGFAFMKDPRDSFEPAIAHLRAALDPSASYPLGPSARFAARTNLAADLLLQGGHDEEASTLLEELVAHPVEADSRDLWTDRYNLACVRSKRKQLDGAFAELTAIVERDAKTPLFGVEGWRSDPDFANLHDDPRWKALLEKYPEDAEK